MRSISSKQDSPNPELWCTALVNPIRTDIEESVASRLWIAWQHTLVFCGLIGDYLFGGEFCVFPIGHTPESVFCNFGRHVIVFGMDDEIYIVVAEFVEGIVDLFLNSVSVLACKLQDM